MPRPALTLPSPERLRELFEYQPDTGRFIRRTGSQAGRVAGKNLTRPNKPTLLWIDGAYYAAHRVAWYMTRGEAPTYIVHIDGDLTNNRIHNLTTTVRGTLERHRKRRAEELERMMTRWARKGVE